MLPRYPSRVEKLIKGGPTTVEEARHAEPRETLSPASTLRLLSARNRSSRRSSHLLDSFNMELFTLF